MGMMITRQRLVVGTLIFGFFFVLWPPLLWMWTLADGGYRAGDLSDIALYAIWFWPLCSGLFVIFPFYILRLSKMTLRASGVLSLHILFLFILVPVMLAVAYLVPMAGRDSMLILALSLVLPYIMYKLIALALARTPDLYRWDGATLERFHLFAGFGIPWGFCHFPFIANLAWFGPFL